jgi:hypothetical protein
MPREKLREAYSAIEKCLGNTRMHNEGIQNKHCLGDVTNCFVL